MKLLVFQHIPGEHPAAFGRWAAEAGDDMTVVRFFAGDSIPSLNDYDALLVMGGPMDVWETGAHPWLIDEISAIHRWVSDLRRPYLGLCLGHQLLAEAMGGSCRKMATPEIKVSNVDVMDPNDPLLGVCPARFPAMHWHGVEVAILPPNATILAKSQGCANQAMRIGKTAWGLQYHPELEAGTATGWLRDPANFKVATDWLGSAEKAHQFAKDSEAHVPDCLKRSEAIYQNFRSFCGLA